MRQFSIAHESETLQQLQLEKQMDIFNNEVGITYCAACSVFTNSDSDIAQGVVNLINAGSLRYLKPFLLDSQDPDFYGLNGTFDLQTATHGLIIGFTTLTPTNQ